MVGGCRRRRRGAEVGHLPGARPQCAQLAYKSVAAWLDGSGAIPAPAAAGGLAENIRAQDRIAQRLKNSRHVHGALSLETIQARPIFDDGHLRGLDVEKKNRATEIIENFMIAANGVTARYLVAKNFPSIRRVVRTPKRWDRSSSSPRRSRRFQSTRIRWPSMRFSSRSKRPTRRASRSIAGGDQTPGRGRIRGGAARRDGPRALRSRGEGLHPFHRPESPPPRSITQRLLKAAIAAERRPTAMTISACWPRISPKRRMRPIRWNVR